MRYYSTETSIPFDWAEVAATFWRRYPNPFSRHVLTEDVISRQIDGPIIRTVRLMTKTNRMPRWGERIIGTAHKHLIVVEESIVNRAERFAAFYYSSKLISFRSLVTYTHNIGYLNSRVMSVEERCVYTDGSSASEATPSKSNTAVLREVWSFIFTYLYLFLKAWITAHLRGFVRILEHFGYERYKANSDNATKGFTDVISAHYRRPTAEPIPSAAQPLKEKMTAKFAHS
jgi:hypothetical protein